MSKTKTIKLLKILNTWQLDVKRLEKQLEAVRQDFHDMRLLAIDRGDMLVDKEKQLDACEKHCEILTESNDELATKYHEHKKQLDAVRELLEMDAIDGAIVFASGDKAIYVEDIKAALQRESKE